MDLTGYLTINGTDVWTEYGAFLGETEEGGHVNMDALLRMPKAKDITTVDFRERNGVELASEPEREAEQHRTYIAVLASWKLRIRPAGQISAYDDAHHVGYACNRCKELPNLQYGLSGYAGKSGMVRKLRRRPVLCAVFRKIYGAAAFYLVID